MPAPFQLDYADPAVTGRGLSGFWDSIFRPALPEKIDPQTRQNRAAAIMQVQSLGNLIPGYVARLEAIEAARGRAATIEGRRILAQMQTALARAAAPINDGIRAAIAAGKLSDTGQLRAFPVLIVVLIVVAALLVAEYIRLSQWPGIMQAAEDARQRSAAFQAWLNAYEEANRNGTTPPAPPIPLPQPTPPVPWGSFGLAAILIGAGLLFMGGRRK